MRNKIVKQMADAAKPSIYLEEGGKSIFVIRKQWQDEGLHRIVVLSSGDFEVTCTHFHFDESVIRSQVRKIMAMQKEEKKRQ